MSWQKIKKFDNQWYVAKAISCILDKLHVKFHGTNRYLIGWKTIQINNNQIIVFCLMAHCYQSHFVETSVTS